MFYTILFELSSWCFSTGWKATVHWGHQGQHWRCSCNGTAADHLPSSGVWRRGPINIAQRLWISQGFFLLFVEEFSHHYLLHSLVCVDLFWQFSGLWNRVLLCGDPSTVHLVGFGSFWQHVWCLHVLFTESTLWETQERNSRGWSQAPGSDKVTQARGFSQRLSCAKATGPNQPSL